MIYYVALKPPTADVCVSLMCHLSFCQLRLASVRSNNDVTALNQVIFSLVFSARSSSLALSCLLPQTRQPSLPPSFAAEAYTPRHHNFTRPYVTSLWMYSFSRMTVWVILRENLMRNWHFLWWAGAQTHSHGSWRTLYVYTVGSKRECWKISCDC